MNRYFTAAGLVLAALSLTGSLTGCGLNPFGGSERRHMGPPGAEEAAPGDPAKAKRVPEAMALKRFNPNGDLTKAALDDALKTEFKKSDVSGDGMLDTGETRTVNEQLRQEKNMSPVFDWNANGQIEYAEFATQWRTLFDRADRNRDGLVSADEMEGFGGNRTPRPLPEPTFSGKDGRPPGAP